MHVAAIVNGQSVAYRHAPMSHHLAGLQWSATGYGKRIPTQHMVHVRGRWRRVYAYSFSNVCSLFIGRSLRDGETVELV